MIKMHGERVRIMDAKRAKLLNNFKNTKGKLLRTNAAIWFNKMCRIRQVKPNYINIRINRQKQDERTTTQAIRYRITQEIKFLYRKKQHLNNQLYTGHLKCAQLYNGMWQYIQDIIESKLSGDMDKLYDKLNQKLNALTRHNGQHNTHQKGRRGHAQMSEHERGDRVVNLTNVTFTQEQIKTLEMGPQYAVERNPKCYINELIIDTENAIRNLQSSMQNTFRHLAAKKIKQIGESNRYNTVYERHQYNINMKDTNTT
jgi:hypothetical protein